MPPKTYRLLSVLLLLALFLSLAATALAQEPTGVTSESQFDQPQGALREAPTVTKTVGGGGDYATLKAAFDAINAGTLAGAIQLNVIGNTTETATAVINASGSGGASYTSVLIQPSGGVARTIGGSIESDALVLLNGADNVTIDGLNTGGDALTLSNASICCIPPPSTIRFIADASNNTITRATILGSAITGPTQPGGAISFGVSTTTGNNNNVVSNCTIGPAGANLPNNAIFAQGYSQTNQITGNNIYDYFRSTGASHGIYLLQGPTDWTISNNRFYQTATRTQTGGAIHAAIEVDGTGSNPGHTISGNTIGYASAAGTGTYTVVFTGSGAGSFYGIHYTAAGYTGGPTTNIQGNTITAINVSGGSGLGAIEIDPTVAGAFNIGSAMGNTIGSFTTPGAISYSSSSTSNSTVNGIAYYGPDPTNISNNYVAGITASNSSTGAIVFTGLRASTQAGTANNLMTNNTIGSAAAPISISASSAGSQTIGLDCRYTPCNVTGNTVRNLTMNGANTSTVENASIVGLKIDTTGASTGANIVGVNSIYSLSNTNASAAVWVTGLLYRGNPNGNVYSNLIYALSTPSTSAAATVNGIDLGLTGDAGPVTNYQNNMIALGNDMTANSPQINGINETVGTRNNEFYFNSVYIGGSGVGAGSANSFAFHSTLTATTRAIRDNIFFNARSNGAATGKHYAISVGGTAPNPAGLTSNNNVLYVTGAGGATGLFNGTDRTTLANWQAATGQDALSFASNPQFLAPTAATPNLHINPSVLTLVEGNGFPLGGITLDFDLEQRSLLSPVDIGADAGNFIGVDLYPPSIVYTPLGTISSTSNRALSNVTITDASGVNSSAGTKPRVYYKRSTDGNVWNDNSSGTDGWKYAEANGASSPFDFTIDYSRLNGGTGVSSGTTVQYVVVAQDLAATPNVAINSGSFTAAPASVALTAAAFPIGGTINSYLISQVYSGVYTVPGSFPSLTNPGGIFQALNSGQLTGNVVINITADLTGETGSVALNQLTESPAGSNFTVTIKPSGAARTITGSGSGFWVISLNGADRVTIDGSLSGGNDRSLTISNPYTLGSPSVLSIKSLGVGAGATGITIKNCIISAATGGNNSVTTFGIYVGGVTSSAGPDNDDLTIQNNQIRKAAIGIQVSGGSPGLDNNLQILGNTIGDSVVADSIGRQGLFVLQATNATISQNTVQNVVANGSVNAYGIKISINVTNSSITRNNVTGVRYTGAAGASGVGIEIDTGIASSNLTVANNFVSDITGAGWVSPLNNGIAGIQILTTNGGTGGIKLAYNSVNLGSGSFAGSAAGTSSAALAIAGTVTALDIRDNIFATNLVNTNATAKTYAIFSAASSNSGFSSINNNDYYVGGTQGVLGSLGGTDRTTLGAWQTATGQDANSIAANPVFVSATNLHIDPSALRLASPVDNAGTPIAGITIDYDAGPRNATTPDIGADEIGSALAVTMASFGAEGGVDRVTVSWETVGEVDNAGFNLYRANDAAGPQTLLASVPSQSPGSTQGYSYTYDDLAVQPGQTYWYWLEDVSLSGATTLYGPVSAAVSAPTAVTLASLQATPVASANPAAATALAGLAGLAAAAGVEVNRRRAR